jgi:nucleoside-diphosphate-sugar epimerase
MSTAIVTGGLGFIGSHMIDRLLREGLDVIVIDNHRTSSQRAEDLWPTNRVKVMEMDVRDVRGLPVTPEVVFHMASPLGAVGVLSNGGYTTPEIVELSRVAGRWAADAGVPLIDISSSEIYGGGEDGICGEHMPRVVPPGAWSRLEYQTAKLAAEVMLLNMPDLDVRIIRPFNVAGPRQSPKGGFVLPRFVDQAITGEPLTVYEPGTQRRALTHVLDTIEGIWLSWQKGTPNRDYNFGHPGNTCSVMQLAREVIEHVGQGEVVVIDPTTVHPLFKEPPEKLPDANRARVELGWTPTRSRAQIIEDMVEWSLRSQS